MSKSGYYVRFRFCFAKQKEKTEGKTAKKPTSIITKNRIRILCGKKCDVKRFLCSIRFFRIFIKHTKNIFEIPPCARPFSDLLIYFIKVKVNTNSVLKMTFFAHGGISIKKIVMYVHKINKTLSHKFHPYSILDTLRKYESVAY